MQLRQSRASKTPLIKTIQKAFAVAAAGRSTNPSADEWQFISQSLNRRKFIATTGKAALLTAIGGFAFLQACAKANPTVVVVGGGIAGLSAAYTLKKAGIMAQVYEASPRTGGRIFTANDIMGKGLTTELGGEFIDTSHADLFAYIKEFELPVIDTQIEGEKKLIHACYYFNGSYLTDTDIILMLAPFADRIQKDIDGLSETISYKTHSNRDQQLDRLSIAEYFSQLGISGTLYDLLNVAYTTEYGLDIEEQSAINFLVLIDPSMKTEFNYSGYSDERYKIKGGNQRIPDAIAQRLPYQLNIGYTLEAITSKNGGDKVVLNFKQAGGAVKEVVADYAVVTVPFTILRDIPISYPMPEVKKRSIQEMGYGKNAKLFIGFKNPIWRDQGYAGFSFTDNGMQNGWDNSQLQQGEGAGFTIFTGGAVSDVLGKGTDKDQAQAMLPHLNALYPGADVACNQNFSRFHWPTYAYTKASYTCYRPGQYTTIEGAQSEPAGRLYFAGEHCSYEFQGFMNGAAMTGRLAAEAIIKACS